MILDINYSDNSCGLLPNRGGKKRAGRTEDDLPA